MIQAVTLVGGFGPMLTYCFEICGDKHRSMIYVLMAGIPWSLGFGFIAYIADLTRHWWTTLAIFIGITIPFPLIYICTMPESFKFLIAKKRWEDAKKSLKRFPKNKPTDPDRFEKSCNGLDYDGMETGYLSGITNFGSASCSATGVYTKVYSFMDWIHSTINSN